MTEPPSPPPSSRSSSPSSPPSAAPSPDSSTGASPGSPSPFRVLFVCWGNICRSPTAEAILRRAAGEQGLGALVEVDSAGVSAEHAGSPPDGRACREAARRGLDLTGQRARRVTPDDWQVFDLLLVADSAVERALLRQAPHAADRSKVARITAFLDGDGGSGGGPGEVPIPDEVPDPYYGGPDGFRQVFDLLERACAGILRHAAARQRGAPQVGADSPIPG